MKIAMLSWESLHSFRAGGVAVHVTELAAALERKGHEVHVFTRRTKGQENYSLNDGVHYHLVDISSGSDMIHEIHNMNEAMVDRFMQVTHHLGPFDLVHGHDWLTAEGMVQIKERWGLRGIFTMHSTEYGRNGNAWYEEGDPWRISELERFGTYCANHVITVSGYLRDEVMTLYQCPDWKTHVVHNGVNVNEFDGFIDAGTIKARYGIGPLDPVVLFVGRATLQKGPDLLIEAIPAILNQNPQAKFIFAADGDMMEQMEWRIGELGLRQAVRLLGTVDRPAFVDLMRGTDIVAVPSRNEPFGIVVLEAWSAGKPVVVTKNGGPNEFVNHEGNGIKGDDTPTSIAKGINALMSDWPHARWLGENGRKTVEEHFSWDLIADYTLGVYNHALDT